MLNDRNSGEKWRSKWLVEVDEEGRFFCPLPGCDGGPFKSIPSLKRHITRVHPGYQVVEDETGVYVVELEEWPTGEGEGEEEVARRMEKDRREMSEREFVAIYREEGIELILRDLLADLLRSVPGVKKATKWVLEMWDKDPTVRRDPNELFNLLRSTGIKDYHAMKIVNIIEAKKRELFEVLGETYTPRYMFTYPAQIPQGPQPFWVPMPQQPRQPRAEARAPEIQIPWAQAVSQPAPIQMPAPTPYGMPYPYQQPSITAEDIRRIVREEISSVKAPAPSIDVNAIVKQVAGALDEKLKAIDERFSALEAVVASMKEEREREKKEEEYARAIATAVRNEIQPIASRVEKLETQVSSIIETMKSKEEGLVEVPMPLRDEDGEILRDAEGNPIFVKVKVPPHMALMLARPSRKGLSEEEIRRIVREETTPKVPPEYSDLKERYDELQRRFEELKDTMEKKERERLQEELNRLSKQLEKLEKEKTSAQFKSDAYALVARALDRVADILERIAERAPLQRVLGPPPATKPKTPKKEFYEELGEFAI